MCNIIVIIFLICYYNNMINYDEIKENFNGKIILNDVSYFFDVKDDVLRIFFNETGIKTVRDFNKTFFALLKKGWISGVCEDEYRVIFGIREICMSDYPSVYAEYRLFICIKEKFYTIGCDNGKIDNFNIFNGIKISGELIDNICARACYSFDKDFNKKLDNNLLSSQENIFIPKKKIQLNKHTKCFFEVVSIVNDENVNKISYNSNILFSFYNDKNVDKFISFYYSIKNFIDILCFARNTKFNIELMQKFNNKLISFANVKIYENYRNYCNRPIQEYVQIQSIQDSLKEIFENLDNNKYKLLFLPIDNDDFYRLTYSDIQNLTTAVEIACDLDNKYNLGIKQKKSDSVSKAKIIYDWCKPYKKLLSDRYQNNKGFNKPFYYKLTVKDIKNFRELRNNITHRATGIINRDICNCYRCLRYVLCNYILCIDGNNENNRRIVNI